MQKSVTSQVTVSHHMMCHMISMGKVVHRPYSSCISSVKNLIRTLLSSLYQLLNKEQLCKKAKLQAGIKPTALCSAIDKENSIEFSLDSLHYLYNYYMVCTLFSYAYHVTHHVTSCDVML